MKGEGPIHQPIDFKTAMEHKHYLPQQIVKQYCDSDTVAVVKSGQINVVRYVQMSSSTLSIFH